MSVISVPVNDARALLDAEAGTFAIEVRLANGQEVRFSSSPGEGALRELLEAMKAPPPEPTPEPAKPSRRRSRAKKKEAPNS